MTASVSASVVPFSSRSNSAARRPQPLKKNGGQISTPSVDAKTDREIKEVINRAVRALPVKRAAEYADVTEETVKNWRQDRNAPRTVETMKLGQKSALIEFAIIDILRQGRSNPEPDRLIAVLVNGLLEIADKGGEGGRAAKRVLDKFNDIMGSA
jgi:hypothetical protein